jgi:HSP20 family molecular chaperone IbpA
MQTELQTKEKSDNPVVTEAPRRWQRPRYDVSEDAEAFSVRVYLPGVSRESIDIGLDDETLTIAGSRKDSVPESWHPLRRECSGDDYRLSLRLNVPVDEAKIKAEVSDGVLQLSLPKADAVKARKITIS